MPVAPNVDLEDLQPETRNAFYAAMAEMDKAGIPYTVTSGVRTRDQQAALYSAYQARGYTGLPAAPPGSSKHEVGDAVDVSVDPGHRGAVTDIMAKHGLQWFGPGDRVHYTYQGPGARSSIPGLGAMLSGPAAAPPTPKTAAIPGLDAMLSAPARSKPTPAAAPIPGLDKMLAGAPKASAAPTAIPGLDAMLSGGGASLPSLGTPGNPRRSGGFPATPTPEATAALSYPRHASTGGNAPLQTTLPAIEAEHQHLSQGAAPVEKASWGPIQRGVNIVGSPLSIMSHYGNEVEKQVAKRVAAGDSTAYIPGTPSFIGANIDAAKAIPWGKMLWNNIVGNTGEMPQPLKAIGEGAPDTGVGKLIAKHPVATTALDFLVSFPIMHGMGEIQNAAVGKIGQGVRAGAEASGLAPAGRSLLSKVPEPIRRGVGIDPIGNAASEIVNKSLAGWSQPLRDAEQLAEDSRATSQKYLKAGANIATKSPITGQKVNKLEELVADYMHAGSAGAKYENAGATADFATSDAYGPLAGPASTRAQQLEHVTADAQAHGIDMADVQRIGDGYSRILDTLGQHMVDMGLMKPEAYQALKGQYLPRLYLMTKGNPGDVDQFLKFLDSNGMLTPEARAEAAQRGLVGRFQSPSGLRSFEQSRKLTDFSQMNDTDLARASVPEATPAALHAIEAQTRAAGLADAHAEIAKNPEWAAPAEQAPLGWKQVASKGPLAGMAVHPAIAAAIHDATAPNEIREITTRLFGPKLGPVVTGFNQGMRKAMVLGPGTIANIIVGHGWFAHAEAEMSGTHFGPLEAASAYRELRAMERAGRSADPYLNEALNKTDLLSQPGIIPKSAKRVSGGVGLETPFQNKIGKIKGVGRGYANFTHDALAAGKFGLYKQLRKAGFSIDEAARRTRNATINYTRLPKPIRLADQGMIAPFITFLYRSIPLMGKMAVRRPDIFAHASGLHLNYYLDRMADALATSQGRQPTAVAARQSGAVGPVEFALPGSRDQQGHQRYAHAPLFAPLLHHFASGQDLADVVKHPVLNAAPLFQSLRGALVNQDVRNEEPRQIVPEGSLPPGSGMEKSVEIGKWLLRGIIPPAGGIERIINAERGTTLFPSRSLAPQTPGEAVLQFLTGTKIGTATQLQRSADTLPGATAPGGERQQEAMRVMKEGGGEKYGRIAVDHLKSLFNARSHDPNYTPNQSYSAAAQRLPDPKLREVIDTASKSLQGIIYGQKYTGADREAAIKRMVDWNYALVNELLRRRLPGAGHAVSGLARGAAMPLAQMRRQSP